MAKQRLWKGPHKLDYTEYVRDEEAKARGRWETTKKRFVINGTLEIEVDLAQLIDRLGWKALNNKSGTTRALDGAITAKATDRKRVVTPA